LAVERFPAAAYDLSVEKLLEVLGMGGKAAIRNPHPRRPDADAEEFLADSRRKLRLLKFLFLTGGTGLRSPEGPNSLAKARRGIFISRG
jgi:hypothetical protein